jgi:hypothetical protein
MNLLSAAVIRSSILKKGFGKNDREGFYTFSRPPIKLFRQPSPQILQTHLKLRQTDRAPLDKIGQNI